MALYLVSEYLIPPQGTRKQGPAGVKGLVSPASLAGGSPHRDLLARSQARFGPDPSFKGGATAPLILHRILQLKELCSQVSQMALTVGRLSIP